MKIVVLSAFLLVFPSPSNAANNPPTVQSFLKYCEEASPNPLFMYCAGMIKGISAMMKIEGLNKSDNRFTQCYSGPNPPTPEAEIQAFKNWAYKHPEEWNVPDVSGVVMALREVWPCN